MRVNIPTTNSTRISNAIEFIPDSERWKAPGVDCTEQLKDAIVNLTTVVRSAASHEKEDITDAQRLTLQDFVLVLNKAFTDIRYTLSSKTAEREKKIAEEMRVEQDKAYAALYAEEQAELGDATRVGHEVPLLVQQQVERAPFPGERVPISPERVPAQVKRLPALTRHNEL